MTMKKILATVVVIGCAFQSFANPEKIMMNSSPASLKIDKKCVDTEKANNFVDNLNRIFESNAEKLKVGSQAKYKVTEIVFENGHKNSRNEYEETWRVIDVQGGVYQIRVSKPESYRNEVFKSEKPFFGHRLTSEKPISCYLWNLYAKTYGDFDAEYNVNGKKYNGFYRAQANMGNLLPEFIYGEGVPFNILEYKETRTDPDGKQTTQRQLVSFSY